MKRVSYLVNKREVAASSKGLQRGESSIYAALERNARAARNNQLHILDDKLEHQLRESANVIRRAIHAFAMKYESDLLD